MAAPAPAPPPGGYSLQVAAFREAARAQADVEALHRLGLAAFSVPVEVPEKGRWVRVFVGPFASAAASEAARSRLPGDRAAAAKTHQLPYSLESASLPSYEQAAAVATLIRDRGYAPMVLSGTDPTGRPQFRVLVEGFATSADVRAAAQQLQPAGAGFRAVAR